MSHGFRGLLKITENRPSRIFTSKILMLLQVNVLRSRVRHPVPAAVDGGPLQGILQHLRQPRSLHHRFCRQDIWRRTHNVLASTNQIPGLRRGNSDAAVSVQDVLHATVAYHSGGSLLVDQVGLRDGSVGPRIRFLPLRCQYSRRRGEGGRTERRRRTDVDDGFR